MTQLLKRETLSGRIFWGMTTFAIVSMVLFAFAAVSVFYNSHEDTAEKALMQRTESLVGILNEKASDEQAKYLASLPIGAQRYTLIGSDGVVRFDSNTDAASLGSHANRQEFQMAQSQGEAITVRYSDTIGTDSVYAAALLKNGSVVRISETRESLASLLGSMALPLGVFALLIALFAFWASRVLTQRIMRPIESMDLSKPLDAEVYEEMCPLLTRIDDQQQQMREQNEELERAIEFRREFSANVSHEMKTPLQVIGGYAELIAQGVVKEEDVPGFAWKIVKESKQMRVLIDDVLTLSRLDESALGQAELANVDMAWVVRQTEERLAPVAAERNVSLNVEVGADPVNVRGSELLLTEMAYNLVDNAIRYNQEGGRVDISLTLEGPMVSLSVADSGLGIPPDMREKIFERFFRVESARSRETGGTGLGLAIVKHTVQRYGGTVTVQDRPGGGTVFTVILPQQ